MKILKAINISLALFFSVVAIAGEQETIKVTFEQPEKYTDFKSVQNNSNVSRNRLMKELPRLLGKSARKTLPKGQHLEMVITNIDMAGTFVYSGNNIDARGSFINPNSEAVRVVNDADRVTLEFKYQLFDENNKLVKQGDINLSNRKLRVSKRPARKYRNTNFLYLMPLFDDWLKTFSKT